MTLKLSKKANRGHQIPIQIRLAEKKLKKSIDSSDFNDNLKSTRCGDAFKSIIMRPSSWSIRIIMIDLKQIKTILQIAGISRLQIQFNNAQQYVNADYEFKGKPGNRQITYQEIIDSLTIGHPTAPALPSVSKDS